MWVNIWTQGEGGDIMRCIESRATGNFESSDWDKASKYTDDTAANEAKDEIANLQFVPATTSPSSLSGNGTAPKRVFRTW